MGNVIDGGFVRKQENKDAPQIIAPFIAYLGDSTYRYLHFYYLEMTQICLILDLIILYYEAQLPAMQDFYLLSRLR